MSKKFNIASSSFCFSEEAYVLCNLSVNGWRIQGRNFVGHVILFNSCIMKAKAWIYILASVTMRHLNVPLKGDSQLGASLMQYSWHVGVCTSVCELSRLFRG